MAKLISTGSAGELLAVAAVATALLAPAGAAAQTGDLARARQEAATRLAQAEEAQRAARALRQHPDYVQAARRDAGVPAALERADRRLEAARTALASADRRPSRTGYQDAGTVAAGAVREYANFEELLRKVLRQIEIDRRPPPPPPPPPAPRKPATPPPELLEAADLFVAGDYAGVGERLGQLRLRSREAQAHVYLLRAGARYALFLLGGESDFTLRGQAIEDVLACREADPELQPAESVFSPRFRQFFEATQ